MTTTDPKLIERASLIAEQAYSAGNLVTCDGYYEFDLDAAAAVIAAAINEAAQKERAGIVEALRNMADVVAVYAMPPVAPTRQREQWNQDQWDQIAEICREMLTAAIEAKESQHG